MHNGEKNFYSPGDPAFRSCNPWIVVNPAVTPEAYRQTILEII
jgi:hypothetical protein